MLVTDFEIPVQIVRQAAQAASEHGHTTAVDSSPSNRVNPNLFPHIHYLIPNAGEVTHLIGHSVESVDTAFAAAASLHERSARTVLVKLRPRAVPSWAPTSRSMSLQPACSRLTQPVMTTPSLVS
jgi:sugar/nucleoside kinase (ribokinase family)